MAKTKEILVCASCGSKSVQTKAWIDANTNVYIDDCGYGSKEDNFCTNCNAHVKLVLKNKLNTNCH